MGADICLESRSNVCREKWEPVFKAAVARRDRLAKGSPTYDAAQTAVSEAYDAMYAEGYFRDNYNPYGLFAQMTLSWWRDVMPMLDDDGYLPIARARELLERVKAEPIVFRRNAEPELETVIVGKLTGDAAHDGPDESEREAYEARKAELVAILEESIRLNEPLWCSL